MKTARQNAIIEIVTGQDIETQNQLMEALSQRGIKSTQATLSRDIKELRLVKELTGVGHYRYSMPSQPVNEARSERLAKIFRESVISCDTAMNIIVLKTLPGLASAASSAIDGMNIPALVGTVAGDDTVFMAMRDVKSAEAFRGEIQKLF